MDVIKRILKIFYRKKYGAEEQENTCYDDISQHNYSRLVCHLNCSFLNVTIFHERKHLFSLVVFTTP